jgi:hypothetical protein
VIKFQTVLCFIESQSSKFKRVTEHKPAPLHLSLRETQKGNNTVIYIHVSLEIILCISGRKNSFHICGKTRQKISGVLLSSLSVFYNSLLSTPTLPKGPGLPGALQGPDIDLGLNFWELVAQNLGNAINMRACWMPEKVHIGSLTELHTT